MQSVVLFSGIVGVIVGGPATDWMLQRFGLQKGRAIPLYTAKFIACAAFLSCLWLDASPWTVVMALSVVAFMTGFGIPATWAYMMDVGGRNAAAVFGWGNMWGNFGAALATYVVPSILKIWDVNGDWHEAFLMCAGGFLVAGIAAFGLNAKSKVE